MKFGISKCMATCFFGDLATLQSQDFVLGGEKVPVGETYRYLGVLIDNEFSVKRIVDDRAESAQRSLFANQPLLMARSIPMWTRVTVFKACVYPVITYGAEIMGAWDQRILHKLERLVSLGMRMIVGKGAKSTSVAATTLHRELNIPHVPAVCRGN